MGFGFDETTIYSGFESGVNATFEPGVFHEFELRSEDMRSYDLLIDGELAMSGSFWESLSGTWVGWGDCVEGYASLSRWDYVRFGVVPEPQSLLLLIAIVLVACRR